MNNKAQKILNYYNANKIMHKRENIRINALHEKKPSETINMNFENEEKFEDKVFDNFDINDVYKRNIKCFCNVYQEKYKNDINATGFGDFIRGCYFLFNFCDTFNIKLQIAINHPVKYFFKNNVSLNELFFFNVPFFVNNNWDSYYIDKQNNIHSVPGRFITSAFISYIRDEAPVINDTAFIYTIAYPMHTISQKHKFIMQKILEPNDIMKSYINETLNKYRLTKKEYIVFHIRTGDSYLTSDKKEIRIDYIKILINEIILIIKNENLYSKYVVISDNNDVKRIILQFFPHFLILLNEITHFGEGTILEREKVKNTMLDFYIIAMARRVYSFSSYDHGTGFSQWCAETYNVPYSCKRIKL